MKDYLREHFKWFAQGALRLEFDDCVVYTDPFKIDAEYHDADYIFITHSHQDHFSAEDINKLIKEDTVFIVPDAMKDDMKDYPEQMVITMLSEDTLDFEAFSVEAVPAYNIKKNAHPKENNWLGYIFSTDELSLYYTGDTELIPEMSDIEADIICLPLGQKFTFDSLNDAVEAVKITKAKIAVPVHYGLFEGTEEDFATFVTLCKGICEVYKA